MPGEKSCKNAKKAKCLKNTGAIPRPTLFIIYIYIDTEKISLLRSDFHFLMVVSSGAGTMRDRLSSLSCVDPAWFARPTNQKVMIIGSWHPIFRFLDKKTKFVFALYRHNLESTGALGLALAWVSVRCPGFQPWKKMPRRRINFARRSTRNVPHWRLKRHPRKIQKFSPEESEILLERISNLARKNFKSGSEDFEIDEKWWSQKVVHNIENR